MTPPPCRCCGKTDTVYIYRTKAPEVTICHECCPTTAHSDGETGHVYDREGNEGLMCVHCGLHQNDDPDFRHDPGDYD